MEFELSEINSEVHELNHRVGKVELRLEDIDERLGNLEYAFDSDSEILVHHEARIGTIEDRLGLETSIAMWEDEE